jgi:hypothetical protein
VAAIGNNLPKLIAVLDAAVNCRNHYVHGREPECNYVDNFVDTAACFTGALEFVFGASDLTEDGWDIKAWHRARSGRHHPFGDFTENYRARVGKTRSTVGVNVRLVHRFCESPNGCSNTLPERPLLGQNRSCERSASNDGLDWLPLRSLSRE